MRRCQRSGLLWTPHWMSPLPSSQMRSRFFMSHNGRLPFSSAFSSAFCFMIALVVAVLAFSQLANAQSVGNINLFCAGQSTQWPCAWRARLVRAHTADNGVVTDPASLALICPDLYLYLLPSTSHEVILTSPSPLATGSNSFTFRCYEDTGGMLGYEVSIFQTYYFTTGFIDGAGGGVRPQCVPSTAGWYFGQTPESYSYLDAQQTGLEELAIRTGYSWAAANQGTGGGTYAQNVLTGVSGGFQRTTPLTSSGFTHSLWARSSVHASCNEEIEWLRFEFTPDVLPPSLASTFDDGAIVSAIGQTTTRLTELYNWLRTTAADTEVEAFDWGGVLMGPEDGFAPLGDAIQTRTNAAPYSIKDFDPHIPDATTPPTLVVPLSTMSNAVGLDGLVDIPVSFAFFAPYQPVFIILFKVGVIFWAVARVFDEFRRM